MDNVKILRRLLLLALLSHRPVGWFGWLVVLFVQRWRRDYLTGTAAAMQKGNWSSKEARDGIFHKVGSIVVVAVRRRRGLVDWHGRRPSAGA